MNERSFIINKSLVTRNIAVFLILCNLFYFYFPVRPFVWRLLFLLVALFAFFSKTNHPTKIDKVIFSFIVFNFLYFLLSFIWINPTTTQIGNVLYCMSSFLLFSYLGRKGVLTPSFITISSILFFLAGIAYFNHAASLYVGDQERFTNNASVIFLMLIPVLFLIKQDYIRYSLLAISLFYLVMSVKRGNIVAAIIPVILLIWFSIRENRKSIFKVLLILIAVIALLYLIKDWIVGNQYFLDRLENTLEGNSSNRDAIYSSAWNLWLHSDSLINILFGYGYDGTIYNLYGNSRAHNDWLEILVDYGIVGVFFYMSIFFSFIRILCRLDDLQKKLTMFSAISIWFLKSCYSMGFTEEYLALLSIPVGVVMGAYQKTS